MPITFTYVYILTSTANPSRHYTGITTNLPKRLATHNAGCCHHTATLRLGRSKLQYPVGR